MPYYVLCAIVCHNAWHLFGGAPAADDGGRGCGELHELVLVVLEADVERLPLDDQRSVLLTAEGVQLLVSLSPRCHSPGDDEVSCSFIDYIEQVESFSYDSSHIP